MTRTLLNEAGSHALFSNHQANSTLQNAEILLALGMTDNVKTRWWRAHQQFLYCRGAASERAALMSAITKTVRMALQSLMLGLGCWLAILGDISPGMMIAGSILLGRALAPVEQLIGVARGYRSARQARERVSCLIRDYPPVQESVCLPAARGVLTVENLTVSAPGNAQQPLLHAINLGTTRRGAGYCGGQCIGKILSCQSVMRRLACW